MKIRILKCHINYVLYQKQTPSFLNIGKGNPIFPGFHYLCIYLLASLLPYGNYIIKQSIKAKRVYQTFIYIMSKVYYTERCI